jgi:hypothetical protein
MLCNVLYRNFLEIKDSDSFKKPILEHSDKDDKKGFI